MEPNYSFSSYADSQNSSPRSRDIDLDSAPWTADDSSAAAASGAAAGRVKFICSYGGKIQPRAHDNQLSYIGGDTKILAVDRNVRFAALVARLAGMVPPEAGEGAGFAVKYQLPGEELDALISVTNDEDLDHLMAEYDRLVRVSPRPARMRLFLFTGSPSTAAPVSGKPDSKWLVDAINSTASVDSGPSNPDFLFGLDKGHGPPPPAAAAAVKAADLDSVETPVGSDFGDRPIGGGEAMTADIQRQIQEMQRLQLASGPEKVGFPAKTEYYAPTQPSPPMEVMQPQPPPPLATSAAAAPRAIPPTHVPAGYWPDRQPMPPPSGGFSAVSASDQQPVYLISTGAPPQQPQQQQHHHHHHGIYTGVRPIHAQVSQGYYAVQQVMQQQQPPPPPAEVYHRDTSGQVYGVPQVGQPQTKLTAYAPDGGAVNMIRSATPQPMMMPPELVYGQVAYDRPVYYTSTATGTAVAAPPYQASGGVDVRQPAMDVKLTNTQIS